jgi:hypothetical protein
VDGAGDRRGKKKRAPCAALCIFYVSAFLFLYFNGRAGNGGDVTVGETNARRQPFPNSRCDDPGSRMRILMGRRGPRKTGQHARFSARKTELDRAGQTSQSICSSDFL